MKCLVCDKNKSEKLTSMASEFLDSVFHDVIICKNCGHIQIDPIFNDSYYAGINDKFFGTKYLVNGLENPDNSKKINKLDDRIKDFIKPGMNVLDVGSGEGWAFEYFRKKNINYYAIEPINRLSDNLEKRGAKVIGKSLFNEYDKRLYKFDLVIFRHALEHMLNPLDALLKLKSFLSENGLLYVVVPNGNNFITKKGFRTSFLRPVHISYFHEINLFQLANRANMVPFASGSENEIWVLLKISENSKPIKFPSTYLEQKKIYNAAYRITFLKDYKGILKIYRNKLKNKIKNLLK